MKKTLMLLGIISLIVPLLFLGCSGDDGAQGPQGATGATGATGTAGQDLTATPVPESCGTCHSGAGAAHQASYDQLYQDNVIRIEGLAYSNDNVNDTVSFQMLKRNQGVDEFFDCRTADALSIYFTPYTGTKFQFEPAQERLSIKGTTLAYDPNTGICTSTKAQSAFGDLRLQTGLIVVYGRDETVGRIPNSRVDQNMFPFAALTSTGEGGVGYVSAASVKGCEKCHSIPFLKHGYIYGQVNKLAATDFYTCKACHLDNGEGGHYEWQLLVTDPVRAEEYLVQELPLTTEEKAKYAYSTSVMNDVHMSHAMEFAYPQPMSNCITCHDSQSKLDTILTDANFVATTCKSCHAVEAPPPEYTDDNRAPAMATIWADKGVSSFHNIGQTCNTAGCHAAGGNGKTLVQIHTGYFKKIYTATGQKYSDAFTVTIDNASFANNILTFSFHATESPDIAGLAPADIVPTVLVGLYAWDTKDFYVGPHESAPDGNKRMLEYKQGSTPANPRITFVTAAGGSWTVTADLSNWAAKIADGTVKRAEIGVIPTLQNVAVADNSILSLNAPSRTFDLGSGAFVNFYDPIVDANKCNNCHAALAANYHQADRGGNVVICRLCHITKSGGSHLEMQSRSIDSYAHSIHSFQVFDIKDNYDFSDPVSVMFYNHHIESPYPTHGITNCESCHIAGKYNVPDQMKSLSGLHSAADNVTTMDRNIGDVPMYITGPGSRACGGCHRAKLINEDAAGELASFNQHTKTGGYLVETTSSTSAADLENVMYTIMENFYEDIVWPLP